MVIVAVILGEMLASLGSLGFWITYYRSLFETGQVYLGILLILVVTGLINSALSVLERKFGGWRTLQRQSY